MQIQTFYVVRFNDCDPFGHLNNSKYIDYMLNAREDHLSEFHQIRMSDFHKRGIGWVVANHEIQYIRPAAYNEKVCIQSDLIDAGEAHVVVEMRMYDETLKSLKAILWTKFTCVSMKTGKKELHPDDFNTIANDLLVPDIDIDNGLKARLTELFKKNQPA